ncbi:Uncharacterized protein TCM_021392 [Theobroma cacao]|uniref:Uncharacterized protein n=1 Tax=Theobroma cacao TaxID=3641 RepID=A0A061EP17_THECC|nr:Uncharacterized protein TCM_021392 [Theobroma cacao]
MIERWVEPWKCGNRRLAIDSRGGVEWTDPSVNEIKFYIDGSASARSKSGLAECGGMFQDNEGSVVGLVFDPLDIHESNFTE